MKEIELKKLRKRREKHFLQEDGTIIAKVYGEDIHFKKGNEYKEIDNTLVKENEYYTNNKNEYKVYFKENSSDSLMKVEENNHFLEISLLDTNNVPIIKKENTSKLTDSVVYEDVLNGIDLEYKVLPTKVKENIIIKNKNSVPNKLCFSVKTNLQLEVHNKIILAKDNQKIIFRLDAPYMIDSNNNYNKIIYYNLIQTEEGYKLELILDKEWLENAIYPVVIDPTITNKAQNNSVYDTYIYQGDTGTDRNSQDVLKVGVEKVNNQDIINRTLIKFDLPTIGTGSQVVYAELNLVGFPLNEISYEYDVVNIHRITSPWTETSATWENMNNNYDPRVEGSFESYRSFIDENGVITVSLNGTNITSLVKKWYSGLENNGIMLKENKEVYRSDIIPTFFSKNNSISSEELSPILIIKYRNQNGIENYMDYKTQTFNLGKAYINTYNGNLTTIFDIGSTIVGKLPADLTLVYNTNNVILQNNLGIGTGYKFNFQQTVKEVNIENSLYLEYIDEDGTIHYFLPTENDSTIFQDEDGLNLTITKDITNYLLKDSIGNSLKFIINDNIGYLSEIIDVNNNKIAISYNSNNLITKIVDANNCEINISYENDKIVINSLEETVTLNVGSDKVINIATVSGVTTFNYDSQGLINEIIDEDGKKIVYEYYNQLPHRIKKVTEYGLSEEIGGFFEMSYNFNSTTIVDNKNRIFTMTYNDFGNLISTTNLKNLNNIRDAYGKKENYGEGIQSANGEITTYKNKLLSVDVPNKYVKNYLNNTSFESEVSTFNVADNIELSFTTDYSEFGTRSLKIKNTAASYTYMNVSVPKGNYYTFSAYLKNNVDIQMSLSYTNASNEIIEKKEKIINPSDIFLKNDIYIFYPEDAISDLIIKIYLNEVGDVYLDAMQLEEGKLANNYNMLENSDFASGLSDWNLRAYDNVTLEDVNVSDYFEVVDINEQKDKAFKVKMNPAIRTSFSKKYNIKGKAGDTYIVSFWYKNGAFPTTGIVGDPVTNNIIISYYYVDQEDGHGVDSFTLNPNEEHWQYFSQSFIASKDFESFELNFFQSNNANELYITNMCLFKDVTTILYDYDEHGNITREENLNKEVSNYDYDENNQLIKITNPKGKCVEFEYDNIVSTKLLNGFTSGGISNAIKYDENNNPIATRIKKTQFDNLENCIFKLRAKGTDKYLRYIDDSLQMLTDDCGHDKWHLEKLGDYYRIYHEIILNSYLTVNNNTLITANYQEDSSLFEIIKNTNGSYLIKQKDTNKYLKVDNANLEIEETSQPNHNNQFYFEIANSDEFIENIYEYSEDGKFITRVVDSCLNETLYDINSLTGLVEKITNAKGQSISYNYDDQEKLLSVERGNKVVNYSYNSKNLLSKISTNNIEYNFTYDNFLNAKQVILGDDIVLVNNNYESNNGNLKSITFGNNNVINIEYDNFDRISKLVTMNEIFEFIYDNNGNIGKIISNSDEKDFIYDLAKRLSIYRFKDFGVKYMYDENENIVSKVCFLDNAPKEISYEYDINDNLTRTGIEESEILYTYDDLGRLSLKNINGNYYSKYNYVTHGKKTSLLIKSIENNGDSYSYKYDKLNNITHIYHNNILENKYLYDEYNQLIKEYDYILNEEISYKYDNNGNIITKQRRDLLNYSCIDTDNYLYQNQVWKDQLTNYNGIAITYDNIGNPTAIGNDLLTWINGRQLNSYIKNNNMVTYKYDNSGLRTSKIVNDIETEYYFENNTLLLEKTGTNVIYYLYDKVCNLIGFIYNNEKYYYIKNAQKDIIGIIDYSGNVIVRYRYDSFGNLVSMTGQDNIDILNNTSHIGNINPFRYRSYYYDSETNLYYLNSRYYNPLWGRFLNADNLIIQNNYLLGNNLYLYCNNNYINYEDFSGHYITNVKVVNLYDYQYRVEETTNDGYYKVNIRVDNKMFVGLVDNNAVRFNFTDNPAFTTKYSYTLSAALYDAYKDVYMEEMMGRTVEGIDNELKLHYYAYTTTGISNAEQADMGTSGTNGSDNNAFAFEVTANKNVVVKTTNSKNTTSTTSKKEKKKKTKKQKKQKKSFGAKIVDGVKKVINWLLVL